MELTKEEITLIIWALSMAIGDKTKAEREVIKKLIERLHRYG